MSRRFDKTIHAALMIGAIAGAARLSARGPAQAPAAPAAPGAAPVAAAVRPLEFSNETRMQLDYHVPDAVLASLMPVGFTSNVAAQGAAKDCNLRVIFIDRVTVHGPEGRPLGKGSNHFVLLAAPAKDSSGANVQVVIGGLTEDPADAPGAFGNYLAATTHSVQRTTTTAATGTAPAIDSQDWVFEAATGEHLELHMKYEHGSGNHGANPQRATYVSAKTPTTTQIWQQEQVLDILRNTTTNPPDRVKEFTFKAGGGSYAKLFDGTEKALSWDNVLWVNRGILAQ